MIEVPMSHKNWGNLYTSTGSTQSKKPPKKTVNSLERLVLLLSGQYPHAESSVPLRSSVLLCEIVSLFSTFSALEYPENWYFYLIFLIAGHLYSYKYRNQGACLMKCLISLYMLFVLGTFFVNLVASPYSTSQSLVMLLAGLLVGHSFDLPRRRDLNYSILVSLLLLGFSATIFNTMTFAINLIAYLIFFSQAARFYCFSQNSATIFVAHSSNNLKADSRNNISQNKLALLTAMASSFAKGFFGQAAFYILTILFIATVIFILTPRFPGLANFRLQTNLSLNLNFNRESANGELIDPTSPASLKNLLFGNKLDANSVNILSAQDNLGNNAQTSQNVQEQLVMQIRTNSQAPLYCRGLAYRHYDGRSWTIDEKVPPREVGNASFLRPSPPMFSRSFYKRMFAQGWRPQRPQRQDITTQIFYIEQNINNVIFTPYWTVFAQYPTETFFVDRDSGLRSPNILEKGTVYTTHSLPSPPLISTQQTKQQVYAQFLGSQKLDYEEEAWQEALNFHGAPPSMGDSNPMLKGDFNRREGEELLALPENITARTQFLTMRLTGRYSDPALKVLALAHFLRSNCDYIDPAPSVPKGVELTDYFIFTTRQGNCRNFASSLAVMCRIIGIPSRYISGCMTDTYNPFTGNYEVYGSDFHAWTEVFLNDPESKWVTVDATSPNNVSTQKIGGVWFNFKPLANYLSYKLKFTDSFNLKQKLQNPYFYILLTFVLLISILVGLLLNYYQVIVLAIKVMCSSDLPFGQRFIVAIRLLILSTKLKAWQQTYSNSSYIEQLYNFTKILLTVLNIYQAPGQTIRQFCAANAKTKIGSLLQRVGQLYEKELYARNDSSDLPSKAAQPSLLSFFKHLPIEMQKDLLNLLTLNPRYLRKSENSQSPKNS